MAIAPVTVTVDFNDILGEDFNPQQARLVLATNVESGWLVDTTTDGAFRVGGARIKPDASGVATASVLPSGATGLEPAEYQIHFAIDAPNLVTRKTETFDLGWYTITETCNLKDLVGEQYVPPTYLSQVTDELQTYSDSAAASATSAAASASSASTSAGLAQTYRNQASEIALGDADATLAAAIENPASNTYASLSASQDARNQGIVTPARTGIANQTNALAHAEPTDSFYVEARALSDRSANATEVPTGAGSRFAYRLMAGGTTLTDVGMTFRPPRGWQKFRVLAEVVALDATTGSYRLNATISAREPGDNLSAGDVTLLDADVAASAQTLLQEVLLGENVTIVPGATYHLRLNRNAAAAGDDAGDMGLIGLRFERQFAPANLVWDGNSLVAGQGADAGYDMPNQAKNYIDSLVAGWVGDADLIAANFDSTNLGVGGQTTGQMIADAATQVDVLYNATVNAYRDQIVVCWEGTNDLYYDGSPGVTTAQAAYDNLAAYCAARRTAGFKVIVGTLLPRQNTGTPADFEEKRRTVNALLRANWPDFADGLADVAAHPSLGQIDSPLDTDYYQADKVHLTNVGYGVAARVFAGAIIAVIR